MDSSPVLLTMTWTGWTVQPTRCPRSKDRGSIQLVGRGCRHDPTDARSQAARRAKVLPSAPAGRRLVREPQDPHQGRFLAWPVQADRTDYVRAGHLEPNSRFRVCMDRDHAVWLARSPRRPERRSLARLLRNRPQVSSISLCSSWTPCPAACTFRRGRAACLTRCSWRTVQRLTIDRRMAWVPRCVWPKPPGWSAIRRYGGPAVDVSLGTAARGTPCRRRNVHRAPRCRSRRWQVGRSLVALSHDRPIAGFKRLTNVAAGVDELVAVARRNPCRVRRRATTGLIRRTPWWLWPRRRGNADWPSRPASTRRDVPRLFSAIVGFADVLKSVPIRHENGPRRISEGRFIS